MTQENTTKNIVQLTWEQTVQVIRPIIGESTCELWIDQLEPITFKDNLLILEVPNKFFIDHIKANYLPIIEAELLKISGRTLKIKFQIKNSSQTELPLISKTEGRITGRSPNNFLSVPYFVSESNKIAYNHIMTLIKKEHCGITFLYGRSGVGKSHLAYYAAHEAKKQGAKVYINELTHFIDNLNDLPNDSANTVLNAFEPYNFIILDNFQLITIGNTRNYDRSLFYIIDKANMKQTNLILISEQPFSVYGVLPERTTSRIHAGWHPPLKLADEDLKKQVLEYHCKRMDIQITDDIKQLLITHSTTPRSLIAGINVLNLYEPESKDLRNSLLQKMEKINPNIITDAFAAADNFLAEYYGIDSKQKPGAYTPRNVSKYRQTMYYLFYERLPIAELRKRLQIDSRLHSRTIISGKKHFDTMNEETQHKIMRLLES